ncbi:DinB family protein [Bacillus tianshenii]|uniref:DinB family protein n=1 Tax=Sutcliffiella tianshenii TaxID=1463404 RepID=UPI001CD55056|nr:DinB family protein [Bacillus tianshenii]MCA1322036.1 DinB family protein [Bacillus tianshenii]
MNKSEIIQHHQTFMNFARSLDGLSESQWRAPISHEKWTVAEVIGHLIPWDEFVLHKRIPYFLTGETLPAAPNPNVMNELGARDARMEEKDVTISRFLSTRRQLLEEIEQVEEHYWEQEITIGNTTIKLLDYFADLARHDEHHAAQIKALL